MKTKRILLPLVNACFGEEEEKEEEKKFPLAGSHAYVIITVYKVTRPRSTIQVPDMTVPVPIQFIPQAYWRLDNGRQVHHFIQ